MIDRSIRKNGLRAEVRKRTLAALLVWLVAATPALSFALDVLETRAMAYRPKLIQSGL